MTVVVQQRRTSVLLISSDLFLGSRIQGAVTASGAVLTSASSGAAAVTSLKKHAYALILIDLETPELDPAEIVRLANASEPTPTIAYGPHVKERLLTAAKDAQCTEVLSRGKFDTTIRDILSRHLGAGE